MVVEGCRGRRTIPTSSVLLRITWCDSTRDRQHGGRFARSSVTPTPMTFRRHRARSPHTPAQPVQRPRPTAPRPPRRRNHSGDDLAWFRADGLTGALAPLRRPDARCAGPSSAASARRHRAPGCSYASTHTPFAELAVAAVAVRTFAIGKGVLRYSERPVSHDTTFRMLADVRGAVVARLGRIAPAGVPGWSAVT